MNSFKKLDITPPKFDKILKIALVGDTKTGKSTLLKKYLENIFIEEYNPTVGFDNKSFCCSYQNKDIKFQICDIAGKEKFKPSLTTFYKGINGAIILFDVNDIDSFLNLDYWIKEINKYKMDDIPIVLVGNKIDLPSNKITNQIMIEYTENINCKFILTSIKENNDLDKIFELFI